MGSGAEYGTLGIDRAYAPDMHDRGLSRASLAVVSELQDRVGKGTPRLLAMQRQHVSGHAGVENSYPMIGLSHTFYCKMELPNLLYSDSIIAC